MRYSHLPAGAVNCTAPSPEDWALLEHARMLQERAEAQGLTPEEPKPEEESKPAEDETQAVIASVEGDTQAVARASKKR